MIGLAKYLRDACWIGFFALILVSWLLLIERSSQAAPPVADPTLWLARLSSFCSVNPQSGGLTSLVLMWLLMSVAMMAPTFAPSLRTYDDLRHSGAASTAGFLALLGGYLIVWLGFSLAAALLQFKLADLSDPLAVSSQMSSWANAGLLLLAGVYQFSPLKESSLSQCRSPLIFYIQRWKPGVKGAFHMGFLQGLICVACCWALMALAFIGGAMSLLWMGVATVLMTLEKLPQIGKHLTRPLGYVCVFASAAMVGRALALTTY